MRKKLINKEFIEIAAKVHGDTYDYSLVEYKDSQTKVKIICNIHGIFHQIPYDHIKNHGCYECGRIKTNNAAKLIIIHMIILWLITLTVLRKLR